MLSLRPQRVIFDSRKRSSFLLFWQKKKKKTESGGLWLFVCF